MQNKNDYITMLGTGNAFATRCYNTCFTLHGEKGVLLVDTLAVNDIRWRRRRPMNWASVWSANVIKQRGLSKQIGIYIWIVVLKSFKQVG